MLTITFIPVADVVALHTALITSAIHSSERAVDFLSCAEVLFGMTETLWARDPADDPVSVTPRGTAGCT